MPRVPQCARVPDAMFYCTVLLLLATTADVFGRSVRKSPQVGIIGGEPVPISEVPYMAELRLFDGEHVCGASIIHERFVLTAAHCSAFYPNIYKVAVGTDNARTGETYGVEKIISNERFSLETFEYDIAVVKLNKIIIFGPNVTKVDLPDEDFELKTGMVLNTTGWGVTEVDGEGSDTLLEVSLEFVSQSECAAIYGKNSNFNITDKMVCAGADGKGACFGDSGGPLTWNNVQMGIASCGERCGQYPGVFTKVSALLSWIKDTIASNI